MTPKLWRIHALNGRYPITKIPRMRNKQCVLKNIGPFSQLIKKEIRARILG